MEAADLHGVAVISIAEGTHLGQIDSPLFDPQTLQLAALAITGEAGRFIVPLAEVQSIGADAAMVPSSAATQVAAGLPITGLLDWADLQGRKVVDERGTFLGTVKALELDLAASAVVRLMVHKGGLFGLGGETTAIDASRLVGLGPELITVTSDEAPTA